MTLEPFGDAWCDAVRRATDITVQAMKLYRADGHDPWTVRAVAQLLTNALTLVEDVPVPDGDRGIRRFIATTYRLQIRTMTERAEMLSDAPLAFWRAFDPARVESLQNAETLWNAGASQLETALASGTARALLA